MRNRGVTLVEFLLVGTILGLVVLLASLNLQAARQRFFLEKQAQELVEILEKARTDAIAAKKGRRFGVEFRKNQYLLFSLDDDDNKTILKEKNLLPGMTLSEDEVVFQKLTGNVATEKTITLTKNPYFMRIEITQSVIKKGKIET